MQASLLRTLCVGIATVLFALSPARAQEPIAVTASTSILGDLVQVVGGTRVRVTCLVGPNQDAHVFEPRPADAKTIASTRLLVVNGLGLEHWAYQLVRSVGYSGAQVIASRGVMPRSMPSDEFPGQMQIDPHAWQDPTNVMHYVRNIADGLAQIDPAGAAFYQHNADAYVQQLQQLDAWAQAQFATIAPAKRKVITSHDAFGYFAAHYRLSFLAPQGLSTESEPSAKQVAQLLRQIQREKIRAVFLENMGDTKLLTQLSRDAGVTVGPALYTDALSTPDQPAPTYLQLLRYNVTQIVAGMQKN